MSSSVILNCYRCEKTATVFIPDSNRVLCDIHLATLQEAYGSMHFASVEINEDNLEAILELAPKQATTVDELSTVVDKNDHRVPMNLIVDHLGELATGVEPATCRVCGKFMQLHAQYSTTKQKLVDTSSLNTNISKRATSMSEDELREAAHPDFLANFADGGLGVCLNCSNEFGNASGLKTITQPSDIKTIYQHLNDDAKGSGHYNQLMNYTDRIKGIDLNAAVKGNLPFYVTKYRNLTVNPHYDTTKESEFPFSLPADYSQFDFRGNPHQLLHTLLHAIGERDETFTTDHGHVNAQNQQELEAIRNLPAEEAIKTIQSPFCSTCLGHGEHPLRNQDEFEDYLEVMRSKANEISRDQARRRKPNTKFDPVTDAGVVDLSQLTTPKAVEGHSGPNIKPHDHHNKPHTYKKRETQPGQSSSGPSLSGPKRKKSPSSGGGRGKAQIGLGPKRNLFSRFPVEKWVYNAMNAVHDMTHTVYENPSYMYRNPNPMYYSVPRSQWGMAKPWRN